MARSSGAVLIMPLILPHKHKTVVSSGANSSWFKNITGLKKSNNNYSSNNRQIAILLKLPLSNLLLRLNISMSFNGNMATMKMMQTIPRAKRE